MRRIASRRAAVAAVASNLPLLAILVAVIVLALVFLLAPVLFIGALLITVGFGLVYIGRGSPYISGGGVVAIVLGAALAFLSQGQALSLTLVHL